MKGGICLTTCCVFHGCWGCQSRCYAWPCMASKGSGLRKKHPISMIGVASKSRFCVGFVCSQNWPPVVLFCAQRQYKLYLSCIPCLFHVLHAMPWCHDAMMPCLCAYLFPVIGSLASCSLLGGWGGSRPCEQAAASLVQIGSYKDRWDSVMCRPVGAWWQLARGLALMPIRPWSCCSNLS